jgi:hypothetical protein
MGFDVVVVVVVVVRRVANSMGYVARRYVV